MKVYKHTGNITLKCTCETKQYYPWFAGMKECGEQSGYKQFDLNSLI